MPKQRIQVYTDPETKRRVELAAAKHDVPVTEYCLEAIKQQLAEDDMLESEEVTIPIQTNGADLISELRALREAILADRGGEVIDVDQVLEQVRAERDDELFGMH